MGTGKKLRILVTGWGFPPDIDGGLDVHVKNLFEGLKERGFDVKLALPEEKAPERENIISIDTGEGDMIQRARKMSAEVAKLSDDFDLIHTHDWFGTEAGYKAKKYSKVSWISTLHSLSSSRHRNSNEKLEKLEKISVEEADEIIAVSEKLGKDIESKYNRRPEIIHNGFSDLETNGKDIKEELGIEENMIFFIGRHAEQKGLEHLLYGFKKFLKHNRGTLVLGGEGYMSDALKEFAEILDINENVIFTGFIDEKDLGDYYSSSDVFVSPSINEPFGLTITEAINCQTPVVATENGVEEIVPKDALISIEPNSDSIAEGLEKGLKKEVKEIEKRRWKDMIDETVEIYQKFS